MSKKMGELKKAGAVMDGYFTEASQSVSEDAKEPAKGNNKTATEKPQRAQEDKKQRVIDTHKVFSFRAPIETVDSWRVWAEAKGIKVDELGEKALTEYIKRHALSEDQKKIYDLKMAQKKS